MDTREFLKGISEAALKGKAEMERRKTEREKPIKMKKEIADMGFLLKETDPVFRASPASLLSDSDLKRVKSLPSELLEVKEAIKKKAERGEKGEKGESVRGLRGLRGLKGAKGSDGKDGKDGIANVEEIVQISDHAVEGHEDRFDHSLLHDPFLLGTKQIDESLLKDKSVLMYDEKKKKIVYTDIPKAKEIVRQGGGGASYIYQLHDVLVPKPDETQPADNEILAYDSSLLKYVNQTAAEAGLATLVDLSAYLTSATAASTYVPYTGATGAVNLGAQNFLTTGTLGAGAITGTSFTDSGLTASKVVFTSGTKQLTSTGIGTSSQFIKGDGSLDSSTYLTSVTAHNLLSVTHGDTLAGSVAKGAVIVGNATPEWSSLAGNTTTTKKYLQSVGAGGVAGVPSWQQIAYADISGTLWTQGTGTLYPATSANIILVNNTTKDVGGANLQVSGSMAVRYPTGTQAYTVDTTYPSINLVDMRGYGHGRLDFFTYGAGNPTQTVPCVRWEGIDIGAWEGQMKFWISPAGAANPVLRDTLTINSNSITVKGVADGSGVVGLYGNADFQMNTTARSRLFLGNLNPAANSSRSSSVLFYGYDNDPFYGPTFLEAKFEMGNDYAQDATQTFYLYDSVNSRLVWKVDASGYFQVGIGYKSTDGTAGDTASVAVAKVGGGIRTLTFKNGLYTGYADS